MRKRISGLMTLVCLLVAAASALAAGTTVTTFTPFADMDFAAQGYMDLITAWEDETGNMVEDYSGLEDDLFMEQMQEMVTAGRADLVVVPLGSGLTKDQLVSVDELLAAAPDCGARRMGAMAERDGSVLLAPVRFLWEALYVNADVLEANGVDRRARRSIRPADLAGRREGRDDGAHAGRRVRPRSVESDGRAGEAGVHGGRGGDAL